MCENQGVRHRHLLGGTRPQCGQDHWYGSSQEGPQLVVIASCSLLHVIATYRVFVNTNHDVAVDLCDVQDDGDDLVEDDLTSLARRSILRQVMLKLYGS